VKGATRVRTSFALLLGAKAGIGAAIYVAAHRELARRKSAPSPTTTPAKSDGPPRSTGVGNVAA